MKEIGKSTLVQEIKKNLTREEYENFKTNVIKQDQILTKLFNFTFPMFGFKHVSDPSSFPLEQKKKLFNKITAKDWEYFEKKLYNTPEGPDKRSFRLFKYAYESIYYGIKFISDYPQTEIPLDIIFEHTGWHIIKRFVDNEGNKKIITEIWKYWPDVSLKYLHYPDQNIVECHVDWLMRCPKSHELKTEANEWDIHTFDLYKDLADSDYSEILSGYKLGKDYEIRFRIYYHFNKKQLPLSQRGYFEFPIIHRYEPLIKKQAGRLKQQYELLDCGIEYEDIENSYHTDSVLKEEALWETKLNVLKHAKSYKKSKSHPYPPGYLKSMLKYLGKDIYEEQSTTSIPGDPRWKDPHPNCDPYCKEQRKYEDKLPCEFETEEGYCNDPDRKGKRIKKSDIEHTRRP